MTPPSSRLNRVKENLLNWILYNINIIDNFCARIIDVIKLVNTQREGITTLRFYQYQICNM